MVHTIAMLLMFLLGCAYSDNQDQKAPRLVGTCEGCEGIFEYKDKTLLPTDTLPGFNEATNKLKISGTIYQSDGKTTAKDVILYIYHTDKSGIYPTKGDETGWGKRHGYLRGWIKTGKDGRYTFYTQKPGAYPGRTDPAHIHPTILEPNGKYYWVDDFHFKDDPLLTEEHYNTKTPRGGSSGVLELKKEGNLLVGTRDFILGRNVKDYN